MKKIFLLAAIALGFGINANAAQVENSKEISILQEKEYKPVEPSAIPADVLKKISAKYGGYTLKEAHVAADGEYKLVVSKDDKTVTAYFSSTGEFVKEA
ncbi:hypothetical protein [uncultured Flavobacterium sp.]|uniref:hypothetical protein n=1 Tax=uncultured Flavobacterium sp. TaxID=165435 RepID=UPI0025E2B142|nr:hypothetical protein [uncultured Flavobacterium sp.]